MKPNWTFAISVVIVLANINWWLSDQALVDMNWAVGWMTFLLTQGAALAIWVASDDVPIWVRGLAWPIGVAAVLGTMFSVFPEGSGEGVPLWTLVFAVQALTIFIGITVFRVCRGDGFVFEISSMIVMTASLGIAFGLIRWSQARWNWQVATIEPMVFAQAIAIGSLSGIFAVLIWLACGLGSWWASLRWVVLVSVFAMFFSYGVLYFCDRTFDSPRPPFHSSFLDMAPFILPQCIPMAVFFLIGRAFRREPSLRDAISVNA